MEYTSNVIISLEITPKHNIDENIIHYVAKERIIFQISNKETLP